MKHSGPPCVVLSVRFPSLGHLVAEMSTVRLAGCPKIGMFHREGIETDKERRILSPQSYQKWWGTGSRIKGGTGGSLFDPPVNDSTVGNELRVTSGTFPMAFFILKKPWSAGR